MYWTAYLTWHWDGPKDVIRDKCTPDMALGWAGGCYKRQMHNIVKLD